MVEMGLGLSIAKRIIGYLSGNVRSRQCLWEMDEGSDYFSIG